MAEVVLFHHALGLTAGVRALADAVRQEGHVVHTPDVFDGATFDTVDEGIAHARSVGFATLQAASIRAANDIDADAVYAGISLGVGPAQELAQTHPRARGALLIDACMPAAEFGDAWPEGVPVQIHGMDADPFFADDGDLDAARELVAATGQAELFLYPGSAHLFADSSLPSHDADAAALLTERVIAFLADL